MIADDSVLLREGLVRLLVESSHEVVEAVGDADALVDAVEAHQPDLALIDIRMPPTFTHEGAVAAGGTVLDPDVVAQFLGRRTTRDRIDALTAREQDILAAMAEGRSNRAIAARFALTEKTVETHISSILAKLDLLPEPDDHRRVLAVRAWLEQTATGP